MALNFIFVSLSGGPAGGSPLLIHFLYHACKNTIFLHCLRIFTMAFADGFPVPALGPGPGKNRQQETHT
jgi:hypothetical protein